MHKNHQFYGLPLFRHISAAMAEDNDQPSIGEKERLKIISFMQISARCLMKHYSKHSSTLHDILSWSYPKNRIP